MQDVPPQDIDRLQKTPGLKVNLGPENRTIFFGMDVASPELKTSNVKGKNPFADKRVRQAINMAIDREAIKRAVMRGQSVPAGVIAPPFVNGYTKELDALPKVDIAKAKALLKDAGYPGRLPGHAALPQRPLHQRRGHLPGRAPACWPRSASR